MYFCEIPNDGFGEGGLSEQKARADANVPKTKGETKNKHAREWKCKRKTTSQTKTGNGHGGVVNVTNTISGNGKSAPLANDLNGARCRRTLRRRNR